MKDLARRQRYVKHMIRIPLRFAIDQAVIHGALPDRVYTVTVSMPEMSGRDLRKIVDGLVALTQSLQLAETNGWISKEKSAEVFASVTSQVGVEIDFAAELKAAAEELNTTPDYAGRDALINDLMARIGKKQQAPA